MGFEEAITFRELYKAHRECARNVRWKESVQNFCRSPLMRVYRLRQDLLKGTYKLSPYIRFTVSEPKPREIVATRFRDRVVQRALCNNGVYHDLTRGFIYDNGACLDGKGVIFCRNRLKTHLNRFHRKHGMDGWVLKLDLKSFFASIPHWLAKQSVAKRVKDPRSRELIYMVIDSFINPADEVPHGIALGSQLSQLIALSVLDDLDHSIKERLHIKHYVRYMDDLVLIHQDKSYLKAVWKYINEWVSSRGMVLNPKSTLYPLRQGVIFLKRRHVFTPAGKLLVLPIRNIFTRERRKLGALKRLVDAHVLTVADIKEHAVAWLSCIKDVHAYRKIQRLVNYINNLFNGTPQYA